MTDGPYRILGPLGTGAMGAVFRALQVSLKREVALKTVRPSLLDDPDARARFEREARAMMRVRHPNVIEVLDAGVLGGQPYIAMELIRGRTIHELAATEPVRVRRMADAVFAQVLDGVAALHEAGLVHRDLKPHNVMVTDEGRAVVMDLGLVADDGPNRTRLTETGLAVGTPHYLAPETIASGLSSPATDVWALGCLYFYMHAGRHPFLARTLEELFPTILRAKLPDLAIACAEMPPHRHAFLRALLERDPERRPADAGAARGLFAAGEPEPAPERAQETPESGRARKRRGRSRALPAAMLVGVALAGVLTGLAVVSRRERVVPAVQSPDLRASARAPATPSAGPSPVASATSSEVIEALRRLDVPSLSAALDSDLRARLSTTARDDSAISMIREKWVGRMDRALAHVKLPELAARAALARTPSSPGDRPERYRLALGLWLLLGRLRELGAEPRIDALSLFPRERRPEVGVPLLGRGRTVGIRWRDSGLLVPLTAPSVEWVRTPHQGDVRLFLIRPVDVEVNIPVPIGSHEESSLLPLPPPGPGERVLAVLGAKHLPPNARVTLSLNGREAAVFRGERPNVRGAHAHWMDAGDLAERTRVKLELKESPGLAPVGETYVYWLMFHYVPVTW